MSHYSGEELTKYAAGEASADAEAIGQHLLDCTDCGTLAEALRAEHEVLADETTWILTGEGEQDDETQISERVSELLRQAVAEDDDAFERLSGIATNAAAIALADLPRKRPTAGVVRLLCRSAHYLLEREPADGLVIAENAVAVAESLDPRAYPSAMRSTLIGTAWMECGSASCMMGDYPAALSAYDRAERAFRNVPECELDLARVKYGQATVYQFSEKLDRATELAIESAKRFQRLGEIKRRIAASMLLAEVRAKQSRFAEAYDMYQVLLHEAMRLGDEVLVARLRSNAARVALEIGWGSEARHEFDAALAVFESRGMSTEVCRARWGLARVPLVQGDFRNAFDELNPVFNEAIRLKLDVVAALIILDIAEALVALKRRRDVPPLCRYAISVFRRSGRDDSLLMAFAYLKDASRQGDVTRETFSHLRQFLRRLEQQPTLLFVPPQLPSR